MYFPLFLQRNSAGGQRASSPGQMVQYGDPSQNVHQAPYSQSNWQMR